MTHKGRVKKGAVELPEGVSLPEDAEVRVEWADGEKQTVGRPSPLRVLLVLGTSLIVVVALYATIYAVWGVGTRATRTDTTIVYGPAVQSVTTTLSFLADVGVTGPTTIVVAIDGKEVFRGEVNAGEIAMPVEFLQFITAPGRQHNVSIEMGDHVIQDQIVDVAEDDMRIWFGVLLDSQFHFEILDKDAVLL